MKVLQCHNVINVQYVHNIFVCTLSDINERITTIKKCNLTLLKCCSKQFAPNNAEYYCGWESNVSRTYQGIQETGQAQTRGHTSGL